MKSSFANAPGEKAAAKVRGHTGDRAGSTGIDFTNADGSEVDGVISVALQGLRGSDLGDGTMGLTAELGLANLAAITPTQLAANTDNWAPVDATSAAGLDVATIVRASTDASRNLTGIVAPDPAAERLLIIENVGAFDLVLKHNVTSTAANRFYCPNDTDVTLQKHASTWLLYDVDESRWYVIGGSGGSGGSGVTYGTPAVVLGTAAAAGSIDEAIRRDATIVAFDATAPTTQAFGDAAAAGSAAAAARRDHKHAWPALGTTAAAVGTSAGGSATTPSKSDHVHATGAGTPSTQAFGDAAATGTGPAASMTDHKHAMPSLGTGALNAAAGNHSHVTAGGGDWDTVIVKASDEGVTNSNTLHSDPELTFAIASGEIWRCELEVLYTSDATGDFKVQINSANAVGVFTWRAIGTDDIANAVYSQNPAKAGNTGTTVFQLGGGSTAIIRHAFIEAWIKDTGTTTIRVQFAQNTQTVGQTATLKTGSALRLKRLM